MINELKTRLGERITEDPSSRNDHGFGFSYHPVTPPDLVAYPESIEEIAEIVRVCSRYRVPIIPYGAGTSVEGHILAVRGGLCLDLSRMNRIVEFNPADMYITVQPGVTRNQIDAYLKDSGFFFPIGPGANATLGGMAATRASGTNAVRYGTMKDNVLALKVVLPDGQVIKTGSKAKKSSAGYNLTQLFVGSEGTLGVIAELTLKLHPYPESVEAAVCPFPSVEAAVNTAINTIQRGIPIARIELLDAEMMKAINLYSGVHYRESPTLFLEFHGSATEVQAQIQKVRKLSALFGGEDFQWATSDAERDKLWRIRTDAAPSAIAYRPGAQLLSTDVCVPISRLARCIAETRADIEATGLVAPLLGHVGDGNFHLTVLIDPDDPAEMEKTRAFNERLIRRALDLEGTCTGEHGIGVGKLPYMELEHGPALEVMRAIKQAIDPEGVMNPGKLVPDGG